MSTPFDDSAAPRYRQIADLMRQRIVRGQWTKGEPQTQGSSGETKKVIPILPNSTADTLMKGAVPGAAEVYYVKRLEALKMRVDDLIKNGNAVETKLSPKAKEDKRFSFFL